MKLSKKEAIALLEKQINETDILGWSAEWEADVEKLSLLCKNGTSKTHIVFLGASLLAKSMNLDVDLYAIKPTHDKGNPFAYSARILAHGALVPLAAKYGIHLGVTGREPLNNQPYFRMTRLGDGTPVHKGGQKAFEFMLTLIEKATSITSKEEAASALRAYIAVRKRYQPTYVDLSKGKVFSLSEFIEVISQFVNENSEGGKRAQAVVAGLLDVVHDHSLVESGRINDPSRKHPGDVCVKEDEEENTFHVAFEVRDKPVQQSDVLIFGKKCIDMGVTKGSVVCVSNDQPKLSQVEIDSWAKQFGILMETHIGWDSIVRQTFFWTGKGIQDSLNTAVERIHARLIEVEASEEGVSSWISLVSE